MNSKIYFLGGALFVTCLISCNRYLISQEDFATQFKDTISDNRLYCINKKGKKIWLYNINGTKFIVNLKDSNKSIPLLINSVRYKQDSLFGETQELVKKKVKIPMNRINTLFLKPFNFYPFELQYFNQDSIREKVKKTNDSLELQSKSDSQIVIYLKPIVKKPLFSDSTILVKNAAYNMTFNDKTISHYGIIKNITKDSIYITNTLNQNTAKKKKTEYRLLSYAIKDIKDLKLIRKDGMGFMGYRHLKNHKYHFQSLLINTKGFPSPQTCTWDEISGEIHYNVVLLMEIGYYYIHEKGGYIYR